MADHTEDDTSAWETINSTRRGRSVSWGPQDDAVFAGIEAVRFSSPGWLSENQFEQLRQPGETERAWQRIRAHDESLPRDEEVAPDDIPTKKQTFAQRARRPRYDFTVEGAPLPKTRRASSSTIVSRVFTAASRSIRSLSTSSSALGRRLSSSARSVSDKVVTAVTHWPNGSVKKKIGRPLSSQHSGSLRLPSAHDAANVHRTDFTSTNRLSSADVGRLTLNNFGNPSSVMASSPPVLQYEPASSTFADSVMPSLVAPRQRSPVKVLRRQPRANDFQALRASQCGRVDIKDLFPDDDTTDDYGQFIAAAQAAENTSLRPYRVRELSSVVRHENSDNISAIIEDYLRGDSATMFTRGRTPTPVPPRSDVLSTPSILRSSAACREDVAAHVAASKATERIPARREPVRVFEEALLSPLQIRHKRDVKRIAGEDLYFF